VIFQVLISNTDAHAKNLSFYSGVRGLKLAPAYDQVSSHAMDASRVENSFAMAIGDAFTLRDLGAYEWAVFAERCELPRTLVTRELTQLSSTVRDLAAAVASQAHKEGASEPAVKPLLDGILATCNEQLRAARLLPRVQLD
jgi:serine/threonine-protein kinase HipA